MDFNILVSQLEQQGVDWHITYYSRRASLDEDALVELWRFQVLIWTPCAGLKAPMHVGGRDKPVKAFEKIDLDVIFYLVE